MTKTQRVGRLKFLAYSYVEHLGWCICALLPPFLRTMIFKSTFRKFGRGTFLDYNVYVRYPFKVSIGAATAINRGCRIYASFLVKDAEIVIGNHVALGPDVRLLSATHDYETLDLVDTAATIRIHDYAWIGGGSTILPGVEIGEGTVVGAGSIVTRSLPPWSIAVGNPARVIRPRVLREGKTQSAEI